MKARGWLYRHGYRPKLGSIFHSPSLEMQKAFDEAFQEVFKDWKYELSKGGNDNGEA